jgi:probable rRNA maturation factor
MPSDEPDPRRTRPLADARAPAAARAASGPGLPRPRLTVDVVDGRGRPARARGLARWVAATLPARAAGHITIALVGDARMRGLNRTYRLADYATDVLSFPAGDAPLGGGPRFLGDVVIARGVALRQARAHGHALSTELRVLALHGALHLLGYDHERDNGRMSRVERRLRRRGGLRASLIERERTR